MKKSHHMILTLTLVGVLSSGALVGVYNYTSPRIEANKKKALEEAIFQVLPEAADFESISRDKMEIYRGIDSSGKTVGYAFVGEGPGYQGTIRVMIGVDPDIRRTLGIQILESVETPGLGQKITTLSFRRQFENLDVRSPVQLVKKEVTGEGQVQAITGATISSQAVVDIVNSTTARVRKLLGK